MAIAEAARVNAFTLDADVGSRPIDVGPASIDLKVRTETVATIAANSAAGVDSEARFPKEAITAARRQSLLGIMVPGISVAKVPAFPTWLRSATGLVGHAPLRP